MTTQGLQLEAQKELNLTVESGKPYVVVIGGREHNVCVSEIGSHYVWGFVAHNKTLLLIDKKGSARATIMVVRQGDEKTAVAPGDDLFFSTPVVTATNLKIRVKIDSIDLIEDPWRPFLPPSLVASSGRITDEAALVEAIPSLSGFYAKGHGFTRNPDVWPDKPVDVQSDKTLQLVEEDDSSEE